MEELTEGARVWRVYNDEADRREAEMVEGWRSTLDTLLIFAGLFSAVVATFVIQTTQNLKPDNMEVAASLLTEIAGRQRAATTHEDPSSVPSSPLTHNTTFVPTPRDVWLNGIWIISLVKQWIHYYVADATGSPRTRACIRQYRLVGLQKWRVTALVGFLPVLMNLSLLLFFIGLVIFFQGLNGSTGIAVAIGSLTCLSFAFYIASSGLPIWDPQCPYKTSLTGAFNVFLDLLCIYLRTSQRCKRILTRQHKSFWIRLRRSVRFGTHSKSSPLVKLRQPADREGGNAETSEETSDAGNELDHRPMQPQASNQAEETWTSRLIRGLSRRSAIEEMACRSTNPVVSSIALQAIAGIHHESSPFKGEDLSRDVRAQLRAAVGNCLQISYPGDENAYLEEVALYTRMLGSPAMAERLGRGMLCLPDFSPLDGNKIRSIVACTPVEKVPDLRVAALLNYPGADNHRLDTIAGRRGSALENNIRHVSRRVFALPRIEVAELHSWTYRQLRLLFARTLPRVGAATGKPAIPVRLLLDARSKLEKLISELSVNKLPSLQDEMSFLLLYACYGPGADPYSGVDDELNHVIHFGWSDYYHPVAETWPDLKSDLILILPALAKTAVSGEVTHMNNFSQLILALVPIFSGTLCISPWNKSVLVRRELLEQVLAGIFHQFISMEWNAHDKDSHSRFSVCIRTIGDLLQLNKSWWNRGRQTHEYFLQVDKVIWFLLKWYMTFSSNRPCTGSELEEDEVQLRALIEDCFDELEVYDFEEEHTMSNCHYFALQLASKRILALPAWLWNTKFFNFIAVEDLDTLFCHFFKIDAHQANPEFPATKEDRLRTLNALIQAGSRQARKQGSGTKWNELLTSWRDRLVNETIGTGYPEVSEESGDRTTSQNEDGCANAPASGIEPEAIPELSSESSHPASLAERTYDVSDLLDAIDGALHKVKPKPPPTNSTIETATLHHPGSQSPTCTRAMTSYPVTELQDDPTLAHEAPMGDNGNNRPWN